MKQFKLFGTIIEDDTFRWCEQDVTPTQFANFLKANPGEDIEIMINSPGGHVRAGLAIANMVKSAKQNITARIYGIAASMASVVACAAPKMSMFKNSFLMIHSPYAFTDGTADDLRMAADVLDTMQSACVDFYCSKFTNVDAAKLSAMMDAETWILGSEAADYGLAVDIEDNPLQMASCVKGPLVFGKMPAAADAFYVGNKDLPKLAPPPTAAEVADLRAQLAAANTAAASAETQRRDIQSKADRLTHELAESKAGREADRADHARQVAALTAEKTDLEKRIASISMNALKPPDPACAQTWAEALEECGGYEAAKAKYPHLADAYRIAHTTA